MTRIVVVSDTHMPHMADHLPVEFIRDLEKSDLCIHAGDVVEEKVLDIIAQHCPVKTVAGNMDSSQIQKKYPQKLILEIEGFKIGISHGSGSATDLCSRVLESFANDKIDICVYGHSHKVHDELISGVNCLNPGSLCDYLYAEFNSYAVLELSANNYKCDIIKI